MNPVAVVTGAGAGVGAASARALHAAGYRVVLLDVQIEAASQVAAALGEGAAARVCDVSDEGSVVAAFAAVRAGVRAARGAAQQRRHLSRTRRRQRRPARHPRYRYLAANHRRQPDRGVPVQQACDAAAARWRSGGSGGGSIVFTASVSGALIGSAAIAYASSKAGVIGLTRALVLTYARQGVRVNAICPGAVPYRRCHSRCRDEPALRKRLIDNIPAGRMAEPEDIANLVVFLASRRAPISTARSSRWRAASILN